MTACDAARWPWQPGALGALGARRAADADRASIHGLRGRDRGARDDPGWPGGCGAAALGQGTRGCGGRRSAAWHHPWARACGWWCRPVAAPGRVAQSGWAGVWPVLWGRRCGSPAGVVAPSAARCVARRPAANGRGPPQRSVIAGGVANPGPLRLGGGGGWWEQRGQRPRRAIADPHLPPSGLGVRRGAGATPESPVIIGASAHVVAMKRPLTTLKVVP